MAIQILEADSNPEEVEDRTIIINQEETTEIMTINQTSNSILIKHKIGQMMDLEPLNTTIKETLTIVLVEVEETFEVEEAIIVEEEETIVEIEVVTVEAEENTEEIHPNHNIRMMALIKMMDSKVVAEGVVLTTIDQTTDIRKIN